MENTRQESAMLDAKWRPESAIKARNLRKSYGSFRALDGIDLDIPRGAICGLIGPNGAGKTTALKSLVGLCDSDGELSVIGHDPRVARASLMQDACFIADVGVLPKSLRCIEVLAYADDVHPKFNRAKALRFLATTDIDLKKRVKTLSKGMVTQLHLALVMAIDVELLILDEPTLGLDIICRQEFYDRLLTQFYDGSQTIVISTHQVEEIESLLSHLIFISHGKIVFSTEMEALQQRFVEVTVAAESYAAADALNPIYTRATLGGKEYLFELEAGERGLGDRSRFERLGRIRTPSVADVFVAKLGASHG